MKLKSLQKILSVHFFRYSLIPIFVVEVTLLIMYFSINAYISSKNTDLLLNEAQSHTQEVLKSESIIISDKLEEVSRLAKILQFEHQELFKKPYNFTLPNELPSFDVAQNGVFYKTNKVGSSLYYSSKTNITQEQKDKATFTESMDTNFKSIVDTNPNIVAAYFNSWDDMNRLYPFIDEVYTQYGPHIHMEDYNFYFLADKKHNPKKQPVWTGAYLDPAGNGWMLSCIVPIYNGDFLEGVTGIDITIDSFVKNILNRKLPYNANIFMVDKEGMIIAMNEKIENLLGLKELKEHLYTDAILKTIEKPEEFSILKNKSPFASHFKKLIENDSEISFLKIKDSEYLTLQQNVDETEWKLMILVDKNEIFKSINELKNLSDKIGYYAIGLLLLFYVIFFYLLLRRINIFSKTITEPVAKLSEQTSKIKDASKTKVELVETDVLEMQQLNENFSNMINELSIKTKELYKAVNIAEELSKAKDEFLANMSHELKTPLNSINLISSIMLKNKKGNLEGKDLDSLKVINNSGNDLLFLINDVLDISKLEAGEIRLKFVDIKLCEFINEIYNGFKAQMQEKNLDFTLNCDNSIGYIYSDEDRIKQILKNLLSNALKFTDSGQIGINVTLDNDILTIEVKDTGIGISKDKLEFIFDRFKQVDASTTRKYGGTGLGLSISKQLANLLGGDISVVSNEGIGSVFKVTIQANKNKINEELLEQNRDLHIRRKEKVIVFNNDPVNFITLVVKLKKDYEVENLNTYNEFLYKIENEKYKYIIVDASDLKHFELLKLKDLRDKTLVVYTEEQSNQSQIQDEFNFTYKKPDELTLISDFIKGEK